MGDGVVAYKPICSRFRVHFLVPKRVTPGGFAHELAHIFGGDYLSHREFGIMIERCPRDRNTVLFEPVTLGAMKKHITRFGKCLVAPDAASPAPCPVLIKPTLSITPTVSVTPTVSPILSPVTFFGNGEICSKTEPCASGLTSSKKNSRCLPIPCEWKCGSSYYYIGDGCDCNGRAYDPNGDKLSLIIHYKST